MFIVLVHIKVKPEFVDAFKQATIENARNSVQEPGIARFDFIQELDDPAKFVLVEVYRDMDAPGKHKETSHYLAWRDAVADMLPEPRFSVKYQNIFPADADW
jgi:quinol monooxygenase YgiN